MSANIPALREKLIEEMRLVFGPDTRRIDHALLVLGHAEKLLEQTGPEADAEVVVASAVLHDIGIREAERKHNSSAGNYQELEGPPLARPILERLGLPAEKREHLLKIIGSHHSANGIDTPEFRLLWDADWLVNLPDECSWEGREKLSQLIDRIFKTPAGQARARELYGCVTFHRRPQR